MYLELKTYFYIYLLYLCTERILVTLKKKDYKQSQHIEKIIITARKTLTIVNKYYIFCIIYILRTVRSNIKIMNYKIFSMYYFKFYLYYVYYLSKF